MCDTVGCDQNATHFDEMDNNLCWDCVDQTVVENNLDYDDFERITYPLQGQVCGTCKHWEHNESDKPVIPNGLRQCNFPVEIPKNLPYSVQKVTTLCEDGEGCSQWVSIGREVRIIAV